jgi:hypothetical protein
MPEVRQEATRQDREAMIIEAVEDDGREKR